MDEAQLRYLRAADKAQDGLYSEAETEFIAALDINPQLHTARFQLGLLQLTCGNPNAARITWSSLREVAVASDLQHFVRGLEALICDDFNTSIALLQTGIGLNTSNPALNKDMNMVIAKIQAIVGNAASSATLETTSTTAKDANPVRTDFSLYSSKD